MDRPAERGGEVVKRSPEEYAKRLAMSQTALACTSCFSYVISKIYEIPAVKTALICDFSEEMEKLGFVANENFLYVRPGTRDEVHNQIVKLVDLPDEKINEVAQAGYDLIHSRHTDDIRAAELLTKIKEVI